MAAFLPILDYSIGKQEEESKHCRASMPEDGTAADESLSVDTSDQVRDRQHEDVRTVPTAGKLRKGKISGTGQKKAKDSKHVAGEEKMQEAKAKAEAYAAAIKAYKHAIFEIQMMLYDTAASSPQLAAASRILVQSECEDVVTERSLAGHCGNIACPNPLPEKKRKGRYHISLREKKIYNNEETSKYCSLDCMATSTAYAQTLPTNREGVPDAKELEEIVAAVKDPRRASSGNEAVDKMAIELATAFDARVSIKERDVSGLEATVLAPADAVQNSGASRAGDFDLEHVMGPVRELAEPRLGIKSEAPVGGAGLPSDAIEGYIPRRRHGSNGVREMAQPMEGEAEEQSGKRRRALTAGKTADVEEWDRDAEAVFAQGLLGREESSLAGDEASSLVEKPGQDPQLAEQTEGAQSSTESLLAREASSTEQSGRESSVDQQPDGERSLSREALLGVPQAGALPGPSLTTELGWEPSLSAEVSLSRGGVEESAEGRKASAAQEHSNDSLEREEALEGWTLPNLHPVLLTPQLRSSPELSGSLLEGIQAEQIHTQLQQPPGDCSASPWSPLAQRPGMPPLSPKPMTESSRDKTSLLLSSMKLSSSGVAPPGLCQTGGSLRRSSIARTSTLPVGGVSAAFWDALLNSTPTVKAPVLASPQSPSAKAYNFGLLRLKGENSPPPRLHIDHGVKGDGEEVGEGKREVQETKRLTGGGTGSLGLEDVWRKLQEDKAAAQTIATPGERNDVRLFLLRSQSVQSGLKSALKPRDSDRQLERKVSWKDEEGGPLVEYQDPIRRTLSALPCIDLKVVNEIGALGIGQETGGSQRRGHLKLPKEGWPGVHPKGASPGMGSKAAELGEPRGERGFTGKSVGGASPAEKKREWENGSGPKLVKPEMQPRGSWDTWVGAGSGASGRSGKEAAGTGGKTRGEGSGNIGLPLKASPVEGRMPPLRRHESLPVKGVNWDGLLGKGDADTRGRVQNRRSVKGSLGRRGLCPAVAESAASIEKTLHILDPASMETRAAETTLPGAGTAEATRDERSSREATLIRTTIVDKSLAKETSKGCSQDSMPTSTAYTQTLPTSAEEALRAKELVEIVVAIKDPGRSGIQQVDKVAGAFDAGVAIREMDVSGMGEAEPGTADRDLGPGASGKSGLAKPTEGPTESPTASLLVREASSAEQPGREGSVDQQPDGEPSLAGGALLGVPQDVALPDLSLTTELRREPSFNVKVVDEMASSSLSRGEREEGANGEKVSAAQEPLNEALERRCTLDEWNAPGPSHIRLTPPVSGRGLGGNSIARTSTLPAGGVSAAFWDALLNDTPTVKPPVLTLPPLASAEDYNFGVVTIKGQNLPLPSLDVGPGVKGEKQGQETKRLETGTPTLRMEDIWRKLQQDKAAQSMTTSDKKDGAHLILLRSQSVQSGLKSALKSPDSNRLLVRKVSWKDEEGGPLAEYQDPIRRTLSATPSGDLDSANGMSVLGVGQERGEPEGNGHLQLPKEGWPGVHLKGGSPGMGKSKAKAAGLGEPGGGLTGKSIGGALPAEKEAERENGSGPQLQKPEMQPRGSWDTWVGAGSGTSGRSRKEGAGIVGKARGEGRGNMGLLLKASPGEGRMPPLRRHESLPVKGVDWDGLLGKGDADNRGGDQKRRSVKGSQRPKEQILAGAESTEKSFAKAAGSGPNSSEPAIHE